MNADRLFELYERVSDAPYAIERLRLFVLNLAVRGLLVEQLPSDEPSSLLLDSIEGARQELIEEGKLKAATRLLDVSIPEQPFLIPTNWRWVRFGNICDFSAGRTPARKNDTYWTEGDYAWVSIADLQDGGVVDSTKEMISERARQTVFKSPPEPPGTILMSFKLTIGKISRLSVPAYHNEAVIALHPFLDELSGYLFEFLPARAREGKTKGAIKGATLNRKSLANILVPLPPLAEQKRIVAKVEELMALLDRLEAARTEREATRDRLTTASLTRLTAPDTDPEAFPNNARFALDALPALTTRRDQIQNLRQTILDLAVRGKLVEQDPTEETASELLKKIAAQRERLLKAGRIKKQKPIVAVDDSDIPFRIPKSWRWARFNEVAAIQSNLVDPKDYPDLPHIAPDNIEGWTARLLPYVTVREAGVFSGKHFFQAGSILYSKIRPKLAKVTVVEFDGLCSADMYPLRAHIQRDFLVNFMITEAFVDQSISEDNRVAMPKINQAALSNILIPVPPIREQDRIVSKVEELMALCDKLEAALTTANTTRASLLEALLHESLNSSSSKKEAA